jgi:iron-sulfur cluster insertion protein
MVSITPSAASKILEMAAKQNLEGHGVRVMIVGGGCSGFNYDLDFETVEKPGDEVTDQHGLKVFVDAMSEQYLDGTVIDYVESLEFAGFQFNNPNAKRTCGCGQSFSA